MAYDPHTTAVHEAGHALVAHIEKIPIEIVSIMGNTPRCVTVGVRLFDNIRLLFQKSRRALFRKHMRICFGGVVAKYVCGYDSVDYQTSNDWHQVDEICRVAGFSEKEAGAELKYTIAVIEKHRKELELLANELEDKRLLLGADVKRILSQC